MADLLFALEAPKAEGWTYRSLRPSAFTASGVGYRSIIAIITALRDMQFCEIKPGYRAGVALRRMRSRSGLRRLTVTYKLYERDAIPDDADIERDIEALLRVYEVHVETPSPLPSPVPPRPIPPSPAYSMQEALSDLFLEQAELEELLLVWRAKKIFYCKDHLASGRRMSQSD